MDRGRRGRLARQPQVSGLLDRQRLPVLPRVRELMLTKLLARFRFDARVQAAAGRPIDNAGPFTQRVGRAQQTSGALVVAMCVRHTGQAT